MQPESFSTVLAWRWKDAWPWLRENGYQVRSVGLARPPGKEWHTHTDLRVARLEDWGQGQLRVVVVREAPACL